MDFPVDCKAVIDKPMQRAVIVWSQTVSSHHVVSTYVTNMFEWWITQVNIKLALFPYVVKVIAKYNMIKLNGRVAVLLLDFCLFLLLWPQY